MSSPRKKSTLVGEVMRITHGQGVRVAFDPVGGPSFPKLVCQSRE